MAVLSRRRSLTMGRLDALTRFSLTIAGNHSKLIAQSAGVFTAARNMTTPNGKVLVSLNAEEWDVFYKRAMLYDPLDNARTSPLELPLGICRPTAAMLSDGRVLITGGWFDAGAVSQIYDPTTGAFSRSRT